MSGFFSSLLADAKAAAGRLNDKQSAEAIVAIMVGTAYADGEFEPGEKSKLARAIEASPVLKQFEQGMLRAKCRELETEFEFDTIVGTAACLKELTDVAREPEEKRLAILRMGYVSAKADGELEASELAFLARAAAALGVSPSQIGL